jgi:predicted nuclease with TOPRIM domain
VPRAGLTNAKNVVAMQLQAERLEQELKRVKEEATAEKKRLEDELKEEQCKNQDHDELLMSMSAGNANHPQPCASRLLNSILYLPVSLYHRS